MLVLGVFSIIISLAGILSNGTGPFVLFQVITSPPRPPPPPAAVAPVLVPANLPPYTGDLFAPTGWPRVQREGFANQITDPSLTPDRWEMLCRLLGEFGAVICPGNDPPVPLKMGHLPAGPDGLHLLGTTIVTVKSGTIWIDNAAAYYAPTSGGGIWSVIQDRATDPAGKSVVSSVSVADVLDSAHAHVGAVMNTTQAAVIASQLMAAGPRFGPGFQPSQYRPPPLDPVPGISSVGKTLVIAPNPSNMFGGINPTYVLPDGAVAHSLTNIDPVTGIYTPPPPPRVVAYNRELAATIAVDSVASLALAFLLLVAGGLACSGRPGAVALHITYARCKLIETTIWLATAALWLLPRLIAASNGQSAVAWGLVAGMVGFIFLQFAYPLVLVGMLGPRARDRRWSTKPVAKVGVGVAAALIIAAGFLNLFRYASGSPAAAGFFRSKDWHLVATVCCFVALAACVRELLILPQRRSP